MTQLMNDYIFDEVLGFLYQFGVEADVPSLVIAASPFCFHTLEKVGRHLHAKLGFPLADQRRDQLMQE